MDKDRILRKHDIDIELSERTGLPLDQVKANTDFIVGRLNQLMKSDEFLIYLSSGLGAMYCNQSTLKRKALRLDKFKNKTDETAKEIIRLNKKYDILYALKPREAFHKKTRKMAKRRFNNSFFRMGMTTKELEDFQNKEYNEHRKRIKGNF